MLNIPIVDAHLHLWDPGLLRYPWLDEVRLLNKPHLMEDYNNHTKGITVSHLVFVQCECDPAQSEQEVAWVSDIAKTEPRIKGLVAWAPLEQGDAALPVLDRMAQNRLIKGIRRIIQFEDDPVFCLRPAFIRGVQLMERYSWSFDICVNHLQMPKVIKLVEQCPNVRFMLNHFGKPDIESGNFEQWNKNIETLSQFTNIDCKLSGLVTEADHSQWTINDLKLYVDAALAHFGPQRLVFGGDWPVVCQASSYGKWIASADVLLAHLSPLERHQIFYENAVNFYRLNIN